MITTNSEEQNLFNETVSPLKTWVEVILPLAIPKTYTYSVPEKLVGKIKVGSRAEVVFGKNKKYAGIIKSISKEKPPYETKEILNVIDDDPVVYPKQLQLWKWISEYYMCSEGEVMAAALPTHLKLSSETIIIYNEEFGEDFSGLDDEEYLLAEALLIKNELKITEVQQVVNIVHVYPLIKRLIEKKLCFVWESFSEKYKEKKENFILLNPGYSSDEEMNKLMDELGRAPKQLELLLAFLHFSKTEGEVSQVQLLKKSGASAAQLKGLIDKKVLSVVKRSIDRIHSLPKKMEVNFELNEFQKKALHEIDDAFEKKEVCLIHGVTSSGNRGGGGASDAASPKMLLLDEPSNALDLAAQQDLRLLLRELAQQGTAIVLITHHVSDVIPEVERVVMMREGRIVADGAKMELLNDARLSELFGRSIHVSERDGFLNAW